MLLFISGIFTVLYLLKSRSIFSSVIFEDARVLAASGNGIIMYGMQLSIIAIPLLYDTYDRANRLNITLVKKSTLIILTSVASITLLTTGYRNGIMSMFIFLIIMYIDKNNINIKKSILLGLLCFMIVSILGLLRSSLSGYHYNFIDYIVKSLYPGVININYVINTFPNKINYQYGSTYLINFVMLLPGPHQDFTLWLKDAIGIKFSGGGVTPTIIGEFYMNFGTKSIYIGMFLLGILGNILGCYFKRHKGSFLAVLYAWQFAHSASGGIANVIINVIIYAIVYKVIMMLPIKELNDCTEKPLKLQIAKQV
jgi:oligosaccharide repeat unit polymerase